MADSSQWITDLMNEQVSLIELEWIRTPIGSTLCVHTIYDYDLMPTTGRYTAKFESHFVPKQQSCVSAVQKSQIGPKTEKDQKEIEEQLMGKRLEL